MSFEDRAQEVELQDWERNNNRQFERHTYQPGEPGYGPAECVECGDDMPVQRRTMGATLCTACKTQQEQQDARYRR